MLRDLLPFIGLRAAGATDRMVNQGRQRTALMCAAHRGEVERVRWLLARGAPVDDVAACGGCYITPLRGKSWSHGRHSYSHCCGR